jgi:hypothetical protein
MRLVQKRSWEHNQAFGMLYAQGLYGACAAIIRQEIDNLMRVDYLAFSVPLNDRDELCRDVMSGHAGSNHPKENLRTSAMSIFTLTLKTTTRGYP